MVLELLTFQAREPFAYSGIMGESIWQEDTPRKSLCVTESESSYSASWNAVSTLAAVARHHFEGASRQCAPRGAPMKPSIPSLLKAG